MFMCVFFFFFSSRRRHTRFDCDWSSDVCSSDLVLEFSRIETLGGVKRTVFNQYDSLVRPLQAWLEGQGVHFVMDCMVTMLDHTTREDRLVVTGIHTTHQGQSARIAVGEIGRASCRE